jgi:septal ring factor EnvC (AmiA/AmiB activator)
MAPGSSDPLADLQRMYGELWMDVELLQSQKERLELKIKRQAEQITRLEASRKTLREDNKQMRTQIAGYQIDR